jgi:hypothetical protein
MLQYAATRLFNFPNFICTQWKFPVKQREFVTRIVPAILFPPEIVITSVNLLGYFRLIILEICISWMEFG